MRAQRLAQVGGIVLAIAVTPVLAATTLAADPTVIVQPGDTLTSISRRHGVSIRRLIDLNDLANPNWILAGQRLRTGRERPEPTRSGRQRHEPSRATVRPQLHIVHVVTSGSTMWGIASHYGVSLSAIVAANHIANPSLIFAGQRLLIPRAPASRPAASRPSPRGDGPERRQATTAVHVVSRGSTLWGIASHYGVSLSAIVAANHIANPSLIFAGQRLLIPGTRATSSGHATRAALPASMARLVAERTLVRQMIVRTAERFGVPRAFALAVAWQESGWQQGVVSHAGAVGVMQLMPATAEWVGETMLGRRVNIHDADSNVAAGVRLLRHYLDRYDGNRDLVLAAYYQGQRAADRHGVYAISRPYIASIEALERLFGR